MFTYSSYNYCSMQAIQQFFTRCQASRSWEQETHTSWHTVMMLSGSGYIRVDTVYTILMVPFSDYINFQPISPNSSGEAQWWTVGEWFSRGNIITNNEILNLPVKRFPIQWFCMVPAISIMISTEIFHKCHFSCTHTRNNIVNIFLSSSDSGY